MRTIRVLLKKEMLQFRRNIFLPRLMFIFPVICMLVMPWIMQMDVKNIRIAIIDEDKSTLSRDIVNHIGATPYFISDNSYSDHHSAIVAMDADLLDVVVQIPEGFDKNLPNRKISVEANGVNSMKGLQGMQYTLQVVSQQIASINPAAPIGPQLSILNLFNPTQNAMFYMIPALMIIVILLICGFLPALNIVMEKEFGTIEQINVMPITPMQFVLAKLIPYWIMAFIVFCICMVLAWLVYGLTPTGSIWAIFAGALLFIIIMSEFSIFIANISGTMQQTVFMMFFFLLNFMLLSGILTPIESMPVAVQYISTIFPPRYFIYIMRAVYLKGTTMSEMWQQYMALIIMTFIFGLIAVKTYKKQS